MTAGMISSIPFWVLAILFLFATVTLPSIKIPGETGGERFAQFFVFLVFTAICAGIAAFLWSLGKGGC